MPNISPRLPRRCRTPRGPSGSQNASHWKRCDSSSVSFIFRDSFNHRSAGRAPDISRAGDARTRSMTASHAIAAECSRAVSVCSGTAVSELRARTPQRGRGGGGWGGKTGHTHARTRQARRRRACAARAPRRTALARSAKPAREKAEVRARGRRRGEARAGGRGAWSVRAALGRGGAPLPRTAARARARVRSSRRPLHAPVRSAWSTTGDSQPVRGRQPSHAASASVYTRRASACARRVGATWEPHGGWASNVEPEPRRRENMRSPTITRIRMARLSSVDTPTKGRVCVRAREGPAC